MLAQKPNKETIYKWIRVSGLLTLIPIVLSVGALAGYATGDWLARRFSLPIWASAACALLGFSGGVLETVKIIRAALSSTKES